MDNTNKSDDNLLGDLAGKGGQALNKDGLSVEKVDEFPLKEANPLEGSPSPNEDKKDVKGYEFTVSGEYFAASKEAQGKKIKRPYTIKVKLPSEDKALSIIVDKLLERAIKMKHSDYVSYRTHKIIKTVPLSASTPLPHNIQHMGRAQLIMQIQVKQLPIKPDIYSDDNVLREAVVDCLLNPGPTEKDPFQGFKAREVKKLEGLKEDKELDDLNPELASSPSTELNEEPPVADDKEGPLPAGGSSEGIAL